MMGDEKGLYIHPAGPYNGWEADCFAIITQKWKKVTLFLAKSGLFVVEIATLLPVEKM